MSLSRLQNQSTLPDNFKNIIVVMFDIDGTLAQITALPYKPGTPLPAKPDDAVWYNPPQQIPEVKVYFRLIGKTIWLQCAAAVKEAALKQGKHIYFGYDSLNEDREFVENIIKLHGLDSLIEEPLKFICRKEFDAYKEANEKNYRVAGMPLYIDPFLAKIDALKSAHREVNQRIKKFKISIPTFNVSMFDDHIYLCNLATQNNFLGFCVTTQLKIQPASLQELHIKEAWLQFCKKFGIEAPSYLYKLPMLPALPTVTGSSTTSILQTLSKPVANINDTNVTNKIPYAALQIDRRGRRPFGLTINTQPDAEIKIAYDLESKPDVESSAALPLSHSRARFT
jgi:hypothetical protein